MSYHGRAGKVLGVLISDTTWSRRIHGAFTVFWLLASVPLALLFGSKVVFVTWLSLYAIVVAHWSALQASYAQRAAEEE